MFEQRYKAMLVDKDNYLLQVSRYIHLNAVGAKLVERPQDYRWCSYGSYLKGKGIGGLKTATVLGQLNGSKSRQLQQYREYVEGEREERLSNPPPEVRQQIYVGDEEFVEAMQKREKASLRVERRHSLQQIVKSVSAVMGVSETEMRQRQRGEAVKASREMLCYVARRRGQVSVAELAKLLHERSLDAQPRGAAGRGAVESRAKFSAMVRPGDAKIRLIHLCRPDPYAAVTAVGSVWHSMEWLIRYLALLWTSVDWQATAAIGTFLAILVALIPIWKDARRTKAQARNLRLRFGAKLLLLRPSLANIFLSPGHPSVVQSATLSPAGFQQVVRELEVMMSQTSVLEADEHDQLGVTFLNLAVAAPLYGSPAMTAAIAKNTLKLIDSTMNAFEKHGLLSGEVNKPWSKERKG